MSDALIARGFNACKASTPETGWCFEKSQHQKQLLAKLDEAAPKVPWIVPGNPATRTGARQDRQTGKFLMQAASLAREKGSVVFFEGCAPSPVWNLESFTENRKGYSETAFTWCVMGVKDDQRPIKRSSVL